MKVVAIIVTYNSSIEGLKSLLNSLPSSVIAIVVDNSSDTLKKSLIRNLVAEFKGDYLDMMGNKGLGYAQNKAVLRASELSSDLVLMLDDDSILQESTVQNLLEDYCKFKDLSGEKVIVCARPIDVMSGLPLCKKKISSVKNLMNSGALIPLNIFNDVSYFDESLFIDYVDYDFGWRVIYSGIEIKMSERAHFYHKLGDSVRKVFGFELRIPSPIRHYYQTRNTFLIFKRKYVPFSWKMGRLVAIPVKFMLVVLLGGSAKDRLKFYFRGFMHGLQSKSGIFKEKIE